MLLPFSKSWKVKDHMHENETKRELGWMIFNFYQKREKEKN